MKNKNKILFILIICLFGLFQNSSLVQAASSSCQEVKDDKTGKVYYNCTCQGNDYKECYVGGLNKNPVCACCGDCTLQDILSIGVNLANVILKYFAAIALLFFVIGGVIWISSGGSSQKVESGKKIITGAVIGMVIILSAFGLVRFAMKGVGLEEYLPESTSLGSSEESQPSCKNWTSCPDPVVGEGNWSWEKNCYHEKVKDYQQRLNDLGCDCGNVDGCFGEKTRECTKRFQSKYTGLEADGIVKSATYGLAISSSAKRCDVIIAHKCNEYNPASPDYACRPLKDCQESTIKQASDCSLNTFCCQQAPDCPYFCTTESDCEDIQYGKIVKGYYCSGSQSHCCRKKCNYLQDYTCTDSTNCQSGSILYDRYCEISGAVCCKIIKNK